MTSTDLTTGKIDWPEVEQGLHTKGFALVSQLLSDQQCEDLLNLYDQPGHYRKTVVMERYRFGKGEYKYFNYPLPPLVQKLREEVYPNLVPVANSWMAQLRMDKEFPPSLPELQAECHANDQLKPTPLILRYGPGGFNTLHQDLYGDVYFPIQLVLFLNQPESDYTGGEFVLTQQIPRAQSKATVLRPEKGSMLLFTTNFRPEKGKKAYYRVKVKHGVSEILSGERHTLGIIFHDAQS